MNNSPETSFVCSQGHQEHAWAAISSRWLLGVLALNLELAFAAPHHAETEFMMRPAAYRPVVLADSSSAPVMSFGNHSAGDARSSPVPAPEPQPGNSGIVVYGVVATPLQGFALVSVNGKPQDTFSVGDEVMPGVRLIAVLPDRIVVERGQIREAYRLRGAGRFGNRLAVQPAATSQSSGKHGATNHAVPQFTISRAALAGQFRSPQEFLSQAVVVPTPEGMLLREIEAGSPIASWGLQQGDLLVSVNGQRLRTTDDMRRSYDQIRQAKQVRLDIQRAGRPESLLYHID